MYRVGNGTPVRRSAGRLGTIAHRLAGREVQRWPMVGCDRRQAGQRWLVRWSAIGGFGFGYSDKKHLQLLVLWLLYVRPFVSSRFYTFVCGFWYCFSPTHTTARMLTTFISILPREFVARAVLSWRPYVCAVHREVLSTLSAVSINSRQTFGNCQAKARLEP